MDEFTLRVVGVLEELFKLSDVTISLSEIKRTKISKERFVYKIVVNVEKECVALIFWWSFIGDPIEFVWDDFNSLRSRYHGKEE